VFEDALRFPADLLDDRCVEVDDVLVRDVEIGQQLLGQALSADSSQISRNVNGWADYFSFEGEAGQEIRVEVASQSFWPYVVLLDEQGVDLAYAGSLFPSSQLAYLEFAQSMRASLSAFTGRGVVEEECLTSRQMVCIPINDDEWFILPRSGRYILEVAGAESGVGSYNLLIHER
jgi:hypothetical protein